MTEMARQPVEGQIVHDDAYHPMAFVGTCLGCGRGEMSEGCRSRNLGERVHALRQRGVCDRVADLLRDGDRPAYLRRVEALTDEQIADLNAVAGARE